jgi:hypothetical protein
VRTMVTPRMSLEPTTAAMRRMPKNMATVVPPMRVVLSWGGGGGGPGRGGGGGGSGRGGGRACAQRGGRGQVRRARCKMEGRANTMRVSSLPARRLHERAASGLPGPKPCPVNSRHMPLGGARLPG